MKNNRLKLSLTAIGLMIAFVCSIGNLNAQTSGTFLCKWSKKYEWCFVTAPDGYCAYGGDSCQSTIPEVLD